MTASRLSREMTLRVTGIDESNDWEWRLYGKELQSEPEEESGLWYIKTPGGGSHDVLVTSRCEPASWSTRLDLSQQEQNLSQCPKPPTRILHTNTWRSPEPFKSVQACRQSQISKNCIMMKHQFLSVLLWCILLCPLFSIILGHTFFKCIICHIFLKCQFSMHAEWLLVIMLFMIIMWVL